MLEEAWVTPNFGFVTYFDELSVRALCCAQHFMGEKRHKSKICLVKYFVFAQMCTTFYPLKITAPPKKKTKKLFCQVVSHFPSFHDLTEIFTVIVCVSSVRNFECKIL